MKKIIMPFIMLSLVVVVLVGCDVTTNDSSVDDVSSATLSRYREKEIMAYEGARLDPAIGPRDNSINGVQEVNIDDYQLKLTGLVNQSTDLNYEDILAMDVYERKITLYCVEGWDATILWKGVLLEDVMELAGINPKANTVIFHAVDGYTTSLPLETIINNQLILAYAANDLALPPEMGYPFIVVAEDKLGYKWARWVSEIELSDDPDYRGFWEQRGYSNDAELK